MDWAGIRLVISNTCGGVWQNGVGQNTEINEEHEKDCVEERIQLDSLKVDRDAKRGREALGMGNCSINIWDESELEVVLSKKSSQ